MEDSDIFGTMMYVGLEPSSDHGLFRTKIDIGL